MTLPRGHLLVTIGAIALTLGCANPNRCCSRKADTPVPTGAPPTKAASALATRASRATPSGAAASPTTPRPGEVIERIEILDSPPSAEIDHPVDPVQPAASSFHDTAPVPTARDGGEFARPGFEVFPREGRLWVFKAGSQDVAVFHRLGEPAKFVTLIGAGPHGMTLRGPSRELLTSYQAAWRYGGRGFAVFEKGGRIWVLPEGSNDLREFLRFGEPAKSVTLIGAGPEGKTLRAPDRDVAEAFRRTLETSAAQR